MPINYSIIIPHYNIPDLLMRCLKSIPVREDVQVIVVDDCSPDADTYLERYPELSRPYLELYSTEKGGSAGRARNVGMRHAKGKWLIFADADDLFSGNFSDLLDLYADSKEDMLFFRYKSVMNDDLTAESDRDSSLHNYLIKHWSCGEYDFLRYQYFVVWGRMIKSRFIHRNGIQFDETKYSNDCMFSVKAGSAAESLRYIDDLMYIVTERSGSLTSSLSYNSDSISQRIDVALNVAKYWKQIGFEGDFLPYMYLLRKAFVKSNTCFLREANKIVSSGVITSRNLLKAITTEYGIKYNSIIIPLWIVSLGFRIKF